MQKKNSFSIREILFLSLGILLMAAFVYLYSSRFLNQAVLAPGLRQVNQWLGIKGVFIINTAIFILFIIFIPYRGKVEWKSRSAFVAFMLALFAEMFGIPLLLFVATPFFSHNAVPLHLGSLGTVYLFKHYFIFGFTGTVIGSYLSLSGMIIILIGWIQIHKAKSLVKNGIYKYVRHPQYTGIFLLITGWMLHWATTLTLLMYPFLLLMYYFLSRKEEKDMIARFGDEYLQYKKVTGMYLPPLLRRKKQ